MLELWSNGAYEIPNSKHQISGFQVSGVIQVPGVRFQVSGKQKKLKPVGAKRKSRLKRSSSGEHWNLSYCDLRFGIAITPILQYSKTLAIFTHKAIEF